MKKLYIFAVVLIFIISLFVRFYKLGDIPAGLNKDESAIGYNAYAILQTGRDEYGTAFPLYFKSFNDYKLPGYIYVTAESIKLFGVSPFAVRAPSAFFGFLAVIILYFLVYELSQKKDLSILASALLAVNPWHVYFSRTGFEVNVATTFALAGVFLFLRALRKKGNALIMVFALLSLVASVYTYNVTRLLTPLFLLSLVWTYRVTLMKWNKILLSLLALLFLLLLSPIVITLFGHSGLQTQTTGVFISGVDTKAQAMELRSYFFLLPGLYTKLFFNTPLLLLWQYLKNIVSFFSVNFFFISGATDGINGVLNTGMLYFIDFPFILFGLYSGITKKVRYLTPFYLWLILVILVVSITKDIPHPTRSFKIIIPLIVFSAYGFMVFFEVLKKRFSPVARNLFLGSILMVFGYSILYYFTLYFFRFPIQQAKVWRTEDANVVAYVTKHEKQYDHIVFDPSADFSYTSLVFYQKYSPTLFQKQARYQQTGLLSTVSTLGKYNFTGIISPQGRTLYITNIDGIKTNGVLKTFYYPPKHIVEVINGEITNYPYAEPAYIVIEK